MTTFKRHHLLQGPTAPNSHSVARMLQNAFFNESMLINSAKDKPLEINPNVMEQFMTEKIASVSCNQECKLRVQTLQIKMHDFAIKGVANISFYHLY